MTTLALERPMSRTIFTRPGETGPTLDEVLVGVWEGLLASRKVSCPVCSGAMEPRHGSGPGPVGGRCRDCNSILG